MIMNDHDTLPLRIATLTVHGGRSGEKGTTPPEVAPIYASSVFRFESLEELDDVYEIGRASCRERVCQYV
jgi:O-acetylhomoserine/O-acetylserine sulfhydrylase-like pyridoxal-dependent enzyme